VVEPAVRFRGVCKSYGPLQVLDKIDLEISEGQKVAIIGPSGSGKTTILRLLMTLERYDSGTIEVFGELLGLRRQGDALVRDSETHIRQIRKQIGMVFQHFNLFPHMTTLENVMEGPVTVRRMARPDAEKLARAQLAKVGLAEKADQYPATLSGGQKQRVAIARALAMEPDVMLFDEATSALDPELVGEVLNVIQRLASEGMTMVIVTHEIAFAREVADRLIFMRDGIVVEEGPARQVIDNPQQAATRAFLSHFHRTGALPPANTAS
jgi:polar amino acid transport system ATP-binding protein